VLSRAFHALQSTHLVPRHSVFFNHFYPIRPEDSS
jgi:hypothetical protein